MSLIVLQPGAVASSARAYPVVFNAPQRLEAVEVNRLRPEIDRLAAVAGDVVIDLARTEAIDGSGVGAIVYVFKRLSARGYRVTVRNVAGQPSALLGAAGLLGTLGATRRQRFFRELARRLAGFTQPQPVAAAPLGAATTALGEPQPEHRSARAKGAA